MIENSQSSRASDLYRFPSTLIYSIKIFNFKLRHSVWLPISPSLQHTPGIVHHSIDSVSWCWKKSRYRDLFPSPAQSFTAIFTTCHRCHARLENLLIASNLIGLRPFIQFQDMASVNSTSFLGSWKKDANRPIGMQLMGFLCRARLSAPSTSSPLKIGTRWHSSNFNCNRKDDKLQCIAEVWQFWPLNFFLEKLCIRSTPHPVSDF